MQIRQTCGISLSMVAAINFSRNSNSALGRRTRQLIRSAMNRTYRLTDDLVDDPNMCMTKLLEAIGTFKEVLSVLMLCTPVFIFTSCSSALSQRVHVVVYQSDCRYLPYSIHFSEFMPISFTRKQTKTRILKVHHFNNIMI